MFNEINVEVDVFNIFVKENNSFWGFIIITNNH